MNRRKLFSFLAAIPLLPLAGKLAKANPFAGKFAPISNVALREKARVEAVMKTVRESSVYFYSSGGKIYDVMADGSMREIPAAVFKTKASDFIETYKKIVRDRIPIKQFRIGDWPRLT